MKAQISQLRSGKKGQLLNPSVDYSKLPQSTSQRSHCGTNEAEVASVWAKVVAENPEKMTAIINGLRVELKANRSVSGKSVTYYAEISKEDLENKFLVVPAKNENPYITIQQGNVITASNGQKGFTYVCPSLVQIIE